MPQDSTFSLKNFFFSFKIKVDTFFSFRHSCTQHNNGNFVFLQTFQPMTAQLDNVDCRAVLLCIVCRRTKISLCR